MLSSKKAQELIEYWLKGSKENLKTMQSLYQARRYPDCLFFGHLLLEKALKALVVLKTSNHAPYGHNLIRLAELAGLVLSKEDVELLTHVNEFNLSTRYPDIRMEFYKICTKKYVEKYYQSIVLFYRAVCRRLKQNA